MKRKKEKRCERITIKQQSINLRFLRAASLNDELYEYVRHLHTYTVMSQQFKDI